MKKATKYIVPSPTQAASTRDAFKNYKGMFDRIFMIGVSPVTLDDLSSGYNIGWNISTSPVFNQMQVFS